MKYKAKDSVRNFCLAGSIVEDVTDNCNITLGNKTDRVLEFKTNRVIMSPETVTKLFKEVTELVGQTPNNLEEINL